MDTSIIFDKCIICAGPIDGNDVTRINENNFQKIKDTAALWIQIGNSEYETCKVLTSKYEESKWDASCHRTCYQKLTNKTNLHRLKKKFDSALPQVKETLGICTPSCSKDVPSKPAPKSVTTRSASGSSKQIAKDVCIFCNEGVAESNETLHSVCTANMCRKLQYIHDHTSNSALKVRLNIFKISNDPLIGIALETKYHRHCLTKEKRDAQKTDTSDNDHHKKYVLSEMEFIASLTCALNDIDTIVDMKMATDTFINIFESNGANGPCQTKAVKSINKIFE